MPEKSDLGFFAFEANSTYGFLNWKKNYLGLVTDGRGWARIGRSKRWRWDTRFWMRESSFSLVLEQREWTGIFTESAELRMRAHRGLFCLSVNVFISNNGMGVQ